LKTATKKIASFLFILLGFTPLLFVLLFAIKQQSIRHRMKEQMEKQSITTITIAENEIRWVKEGKEVWIHGKLFDIKSIEHKDGMAILHGLYDDDETTLFTAFNKTWEKNCSDQNQLLSHLFECLQDTYFSQHTGIPALPHKQHHIAELSSPKLLSQFKIILTPPPQA
jgi:hypothetical protein